VIEFISITSLFITNLRGGGSFQFKAKLSNQLRTVLLEKMIVAQLVKSIYFFSCSKEPFIILSAEHHNKERDENAYRRLAAISKGKALFRKCARSRKGNIEMYLKEQGNYDVDWILLARDRVKWDIENTAINLHFPYPVANFCVALDS
jgi:hypothetical protein